MEMGIDAGIGMSAMEVVSMVLNVLLGGSLIVTIITIKATRKKADAEAKSAEAGAKSTEIENVDAAVKIWRELAEKMSEQYTDVSLKVDKLSKEVNGLRLVNNKILRLLDRITPENLIEMVEKIKAEINESESTHISFPDPDPADQL